MTARNFLNSSPYEKLMEAVSGEGRYQNFLLLMALLPLLVVPFMHTGSVFIAGLPPSRCLVEAVDNVSGSILSDDFTTKTFIPYNKVTHSNDRCKQYNYSVKHCESNLTEECLANLTLTLKQPEVIPCQNGFYFDRTTFDETITTEWNLVCDNLILMTISSSVYYIGLFCGAIVGGMLSDRYGRVRVCQGSSVLWFICGLALAFSPNIYVFLVLRFLLAASLMPLTVAAFVYSTEISKNFLRPTIGSLYNAVFGLGCVLMSVMAYRWRHWKELEIAFSLCVIPVIAILFFICPKSPRWLLSKGKTVEAHRVCKIMARRNNGKLPEKLFDEAQSQATKETNASLKELIRRPYLRFTLLCNCIVWSVTSLIFYGLALNSGALFGSIHLNHALGGVMEFVACLVCIPVFVVWGRRNTTVATLAISSASCLLSTVCIQLGKGNRGAETAGVALAMVGRFSSSATFAAVYQFTVELFPTPGRGTALGASSMAARFGSIITPFSLQLQYEIPWLTQTIFGVVAMIAAITASCLPETNHRPLLSSFAESEEFLRDHFRNSWVSPLFRSKKNGFPQNKKEAPLMTEDMKC